MIIYSNDHPSSPRYTSRDTNMCLARAPSPRRRTIPILAAPLLGDYGSRGLPIAFLLCRIAWLIEEIPHDGVASFCLATLQDYVLGKDLSKLPYAVVTITGLNLG